MSVKLMPIVMDGRMEDNCVLRLGRLNIRSLAKKFNSVSDLITDKDTDVLQLLRHGTTLSASFVSMVNRSSTSSYDESWWTGGNWVFNSWTTSARYQVKHEYI